MSDEQILDVIASIILDADGRPFAPFVLARLRDAGYEVVKVGPTAEVGRVDSDEMHRIQFTDDGLIVLPYGGEECGS